MFDVHPSTFNVRRSRFDVRSSPFTALVLLSGLLLSALTFGAATMSAAAADPLPIADLNRSTPVDFESEILPILRRNCLACHGEQKPKGGLVLETPQSIAKGGDSGEAVVPGKAAESYLLQVAAHQVEETVMPPSGNKVNAVDLSPEELALLKLWIDQGAKGEVRAARPVQWHRMPASLQAIHTVALSADGQFAACGRANQIDLYHLPSRQFVARLKDAALGGTALYGEAGAAHLDMVQSLAFSPDGSRLASGGYRVIKIWKRVPSRAAWQAAIEELPPVARSVSSPDGRWLATAHEGGAVTLWKTGDGSAVRTWRDPAETLAALAFNESGAWLAGATPGGATWIWDVEQGALLLHAATGEAVRSLCFAKDSALLVAGLEDHRIRTWHIARDAGAALNPIAELKGHAAPVTHLLPVPGRPAAVLAASQDGSIRLWDLDKGEAERTLEQGEPVTALALRPDGKRLASAGTGAGVTLWNIEDGSKVAALKGDRHATDALAASEREKTLAAADIELCKTDLGEAEKEFTTQEERLKKANEVFEPANKAYAEKSKALEDAKKGKADAEQALASMHEEIHRVTEAFAKAEQASKEAQTRAQSVAAAAAQAQAAAENALHARQESETFLAEATRMAEAARTAAGLSSLGDAEKKLAETRLASAGAVIDQTRQILQGAEAELAKRRQQAEQARLEANQSIEQVALAAFEAGKVRVEFERVTHGAEDRLKNATNSVQEAAKKIEAADKEFAKAEMDKTQAQTELDLARAAQERATATVAAGKQALQSAEEADKTAAAALETMKQRAAAAEARMIDVRFTRDNQSVLTLGEDGRLFTWHAESGVPFDVLPAASPAWRQIALADDRGVIGIEPRHATRWELTGHWELERTLGTGGPDSPIVDRVNALAFSPDGAWLASGGGEPSRSGELKIWQVKDGTLLKDLPNVHSDTVLALSFTRDKALLASAASDKFARVVDTATWEVTRSFEGHTHHVMGVSWKGDRRTLATSGADMVVKVWDYRKGERRKNIEGFGKEVTSIQFVGPTGQALVSAGDNKVRLLQEDGKEIRTYSGVEDFQHAAAITPDGKWVVAGGEGSKLRLWEGEGKLVATFDPPGAEVSRD